jgi:hypothetical protein
MFAAILFQLPIVLLPFANLPAPPDECRLEVLSPQALEERTLADFEGRVSRYVTLHRRLERSLPPEQMFDDPEDMYAAVEALRQALVEARPTARAGNMFTPAVARLLTDRVEEALHNQRLNLGDVLAGTSEGRLPGMPRPEVNQAFAWGYGSAIPPTLIAVLPALPVELEYRFVERTLVLVDLHADLVVDVIEDALPAVEPPTSDRRHLH